MSIKDVSLIFFIYGDDSMYQYEILDMLKNIGVKEIKIKNDLWSGYIFDCTNYCNDKMAPEEKRYLQWSPEDGFTFLHGEEEYRKFKESGRYDSDVDWIDAVIDSETDCVIFNIGYYMDAMVPYEQGGYCTAVCGVVPVKFLEENGINLVSFKEEGNKDAV